MSTRTTKNVMALWKLKYVRIKSIIIFHIIIIIHSVC